MGEAKYYPVVRAWLEREGYYCGGFIENPKGKPIYYQNKGTKRLRIDVAGIRNVGTSLMDEIEVAAVEVRDVDSIQFRDIQDASAYSQYAHKCYLATTGIIDKQDKEEANFLGVGLLKIQSQKIKEVVSPRLNIPNHARMLHFLNVLDVSQCPLCGCFFETYRVGSRDYRSFYAIRRTKYFNAAHDYPKLDVFEKGERKELPGNYKIRRYLCRSCMEEFFPQKIGKEANAADS